MFLDVIDNPISPLFPKVKSLSLQQEFCLLFQRMSQRQQKIARYTQMDLMQDLLLNMMIDGAQWEDQALLVIHADKELQGLLIDENIYVFDAKNRLCVLSSLYPEIKSCNDALLLGATQSMFKGMNHFYR